MYYGAADKLDKYQHIDSNSNAMMWICQASRRPNRKIPQHKYNCSQDDCKDLQRDVKTKSKMWVAIVELCNKYGCWYYAKESYCCDYAMSENEGVVLRYCGESIAHA